MKQYLAVKQKTPLKKLLIPLIGFILIVVLYLHWLSKGAIPKQYLKPIKIDTTVESQVLKGIGTIQPTQRELVSAPSDGTINSLQVREGQSVKRGDVLAELSNYDLEQKIHTAQLELLNISSQVSIDKSNLRIRLSQVKSELANSKMQLKLQELELGANKKLAKEGIISSIRFEQSRMQFKQSELELAAKTEELALFEHAYQQQLLAYDNKIQLAENQLEYLNKRKTQLILTAQFEGVISQNSSKLGQVVKQGQSLFELIETNNLLAKVQVPQYSSNKLEKGQDAKIITPSGEIKAKVDYIDTVIRNGAINVFLTLNSVTPNWLRSDQAIEAHIYTSQSQASFSVLKPDNFRDFEHWNIFEVTADNRAILTRIKYHELDNSKLSFAEKLAGNYVLLIPDAYTKKDSVDFNFGNAYE